MKLGRRVLVLLVFTLLWIPATGLSDQAYHLFFIERSKNKNIVQYDFCPEKGGNPNGAGPVVAYWITESGEKRELSPIQRELAFGIASQKKLTVDRYEIVLKAFRERKITIRKTEEGYKAFGTIDGRMAYNDVFTAGDEQHVGEFDVLPLGHTQPLDFYFLSGSYLVLLAAGLHYRVCLCHVQKRT